MDPPRQVYSTSVFFALHLILTYVLLCDTIVLFLHRRGSIYTYWCSALLPHQVPTPLNHTALQHTAYIYHCTTLHCTALHQPVLHHTVKLSYTESLHCTVTQCIILHITALQCSISNCFILYSTVRT